MKRKKKKSHTANLRSLRELLGWTQSDMALVLNISRSDYSMLEYRNRCVRKNLKEKIEYLERLGDMMKSDQVTERLLEPTPDLAFVKSTLTGCVKELERKISTKENQFETRKRNTTRAIRLRHRFECQLSMLKEIGAPTTMTNGMHLRVNEFENKLLKTDIDVMVMQEARLAGMKAEMQHILDFLKNNP